MPVLAELGATCSMPCKSRISLPAFALWLAFAIAAIFSSLTAYAQRI